MDELTGRRSAPAAGSAAEVDPSSRLEEMARGRRDRALQAAARAYTVAHGVHEQVTPPTGTPRWSTPVRTAVAAAVAVLLLAAMLAIRSVAAGAGTVVDLDDQVERPGATAEEVGQQGEPAAGHPEGATADLVVHVVGEVAEPGLVTVPHGARVADALARAGGPTADADLAALNLAREVLDGEQLRVPAPGETPVPGGVDGAGADVSRADIGRVDINRADATALQALPGIGPVLAARIVDHRRERPFSSVDELLEVTGIGTKILAGIRDLVTV